LVLLDVKPPTRKALPDEALWLLALEEGSVQQKLRRPRRQ